MQLYLRNKMTGEIKDVEADSAEFRELAQEVTPGGLSKWEQTNYPHAEAIKGRARYGELQEEDLGVEDQDELRPAAVVLALEGVAPERNPHLALTPAEIDAGLTPRDKLRDLEEMYEQRRTGAFRGVFEKAADRIADEREERPTVSAVPQTSRAGGDPPPELGEGGTQEAASSSKHKSASGATSQPAGKPGGSGDGSSGGGGS